MGAALDQGTHWEAARDDRARAGLTQGTSGNGGQARARVRQVVTGGSVGCNQGSATGGSGALRRGSSGSGRAAVAQVDRARQALSSKGGKGEVKVNGPSLSPFINQLDN